MSKSKHTPGPWEADKDGVTEANSGAGLWIADCNPSDSWEQSTAEANARLIAAAPDMLSELVILYRALSSGKQSDLAQIRHPAEMSYLAELITRARGSEE